MGQSDPASPDPYKRGRLDGCAIHARREAAALRSRAYDAAVIEAASDPATHDDLRAALATFAPGTEPELIKVASAYEAATHHRVLPPDFPPLTD